MYAVSDEFFAQDLESKVKLQNEYTYSGYSSLGEEITAGRKDLLETFTLCREYQLDHPYVLQNKPLHGPVPWPNEQYKNVLTNFSTKINPVGDQILSLLALGLGIKENYFESIMKESFFIARVMKYPDMRYSTQLGINSHTDYGMLVIGGSDVSGLYVRPPHKGEER